MNSAFLVTSVALAGALTPHDALPAQDLPVRRQALETKEEKVSGLTNLLSLEAIRASIGDAADGLSVDLSRVTGLLDGTTIDPAKIYGDVYAGPYPFEANEARYPYKRFRVSASVTGGKALVDIAALFSSATNSEGWTDEGQVALRFILKLESEGKDRSIGVYDTIVAFHRSGSRFVRHTTLLEGPHVNLVHSDAPDRATITFLTSEEIKAFVELQDESGAILGTFRDERAATRHEIELTGLDPDREYRYLVRAGSFESRPLRLRTAPPQGDATVRFGYFGDSRAGPGGGLESYMGVNYSTLSALTHLAWTNDAAFLLVGGDLVNGYTTERADFEAQLHAWKQAVTGFWHERPIYATMGNHEALLRVFEGDIKIDRWPYSTDSAEAVFAQVFTHPRNGPTPSDARRPSYTENVYSFQHGPVLVIAFNNNYWVSYHADEYGGAPEGYLLEDQIAWIEAELARAEAEPTIRWVVLFAQEPVFPGGGHLGDSMWHDGDNRVRAHTWRDGKLWPEEAGMVSVRNRLVRSVAAASKVAVVLGSDEHAYHRVLIGSEVPIGDIERDDPNLSGQIDHSTGEPVSPLADLARSTWYIVCGGGGAPYYSEQETPWSRHWNGRRTKAGHSGHFFSSQENIVLFEADASRIGIRVLNPLGEVIDEIENLMADR